MNALTIAETANLTMSSREIANLTDKRHADVMRDIRNMLGQLELQADGYTQNCADPPKRPDVPSFQAAQRPDADLGRRVQREAAEADH